MGKCPDHRLGLVLCWSRGLPFKRVPAVPVLVRWSYGKDQTISLIRIQARQAIPAVREHAAALFSENHLSSAAVELLPHAVILQSDADAFEGEQSRKDLFRVRTAKCVR